MSQLTRLLVPLSAAVVCAGAAAPAALASSSVTFPSTGTPVTTVQMTDPGPSSNFVHLTVTAADHAQLAGTKVFLGTNGTDTPYVSIGVDGVRDARYSDGFDGDQLSTPSCSITDSTERFDVPVTVAGDGGSYSADLPKGVVVSFEDAGVDVAIAGVDAACQNSTFHGLATDYLNDRQVIDGFSWDAPATPDVTAATGRRQVALSFDQDPGTQYDIYRVVDGVRESTPFMGNIRGDGSDVQVVLDRTPDDRPLAPGTQYAFQVQATRLFNVWSGSDMIQPTSGFSPVATATTSPVQVVRFGTVPAASTTDTSAQFGWTVDGLPGDETPFCALDANSAAEREIACTATGASVAGLSVGAHTLTVYGSDGEVAYPYSWTVTAPAAAPAPAPAVVPAPVAPVIPVPVKNRSDLDGDGIVNTWLIGTKPAPAPAAPKATVTGTTVKLTLAAAPKGATKVRVYRADGTGGFALVKTLAPKSRTFTDTKVKGGHTYRYKAVGVNAKGQQSSASKATTAKVAKKQ
jgi:hypothetical protein